MIYLRVRAVARSSSDRRAWSHGNRLFCDLQNRCASRVHICIIGDFGRRLRSPVRPPWISTLGSFPVFKGRRSSILPCRHMISPISRAHQYTSDSSHYSIAYPVRDGSKCKPADSTSETYIMSFVRLQDFNTLTSSHLNVDTQDAARNNDLYCRNFSSFAQLSC